MLQPTIRQLLTRIEQLETEFEAPEAERLEVWRDLVNWFAWAGQQADTWQAFSALPMDSPIRELKNSLMWSFRYFAVRIPDTLKTGDWVDKSKLCIEHFIRVGLDLESPDELSEPGYLDACMTWTIAQLLDTESWREWEERQEQSRTRQAQPVEGPEVQPVTIIDNPAIDTPTIKSEQAKQGGVQNGDIIEAKYIGGKTGFFVQTADGLMKIIKGRRYRLPGHIWRNIIEFEKKEWQKL